MGTQRKASKNKHISENHILEAYNRYLPAFSALKDEANFIISHALGKSGIKIHAVEHRIKTYDSLRNKISSGGHESIDEILDAVGLRIVCLFKSDLPNVCEIISSEFDVISFDDKVDSSTDSFGYMSIHFICEMKKAYSGPRYDAIRGMRFEIQVRTLCMHAWAAISHYLDYKAEWDIPDHLKKGLNALSGLFYVADVQYEQLYSSRQISKEQSDTASPTESEDQPINFDTVFSMLRRIFPDRKTVDSEKISIFVKELTVNNYTNIGNIERDIVNSYDHVLKYDAEIKENQDPLREGLFFADLGAARVALRHSNKAYVQLTYPQTHMVGVKSPRTGS
ncbi:MULTISPECIES: GTP pyrophosphokinase [unclassified Sphingobium]|uniref:GTP pyrophosphokinase n=1 Tax=unclassified Sphingobium TaxID=2611147 RepID=UPI0007705B26|nr:hypothetical protein [Sphingobium sp. TKS]AMK22418.1 RelA/SpoT domain-containing protein [Sphingobium sp. TKS]NML90032.1 hypothetical protein [Sphingobium sp. TB-6]